MWLFIKQLTFRIDLCINIKPACFMFRRAVSSSFGKLENIPELSVKIARKKFSASFSVGWYRLYQRWDSETATKHRQTVARQNCSRKQARVGEKNKIILCFPDMATVHCKVFPLTFC